MVSYQTWTSIAFEVANEKGAQFESIEDGGEAIEVFASIWRDRKDELSRATMTEARRVANEEITA